MPVLPLSSVVFFGLDRKTFDAAHIVRSVIEGTVFNLGYGFARMRDLGLRPAEIRATGGGAKSRLWLQIVADVFRDSGRDAPGDGGGRLRRRPPVDLELVVR